MTLPRYLRCFAAERGRAGRQRRLRLAPPHYVVRASNSCGTPTRTASVFSIRRVHSGMRGARLAVQPAGLTLTLTSTLPGYGTRRRCGNLRRHGTAARCGTSPIPRAPQRQGRHERTCAPVSRSRRSRRVPSYTGLRWRLCYHRYRTACLHPTRTAATCGYGYTLAHLCLHENEKAKKNAG